MKKIIYFLLLLPAIFSFTKAKGQCHVSIGNLTLCNFNAYTTYYDGSSYRTVEHQLQGTQSINFTLSPCNGVYSQSLHDESNQVLSILYTSGFVEFQGCNSSLNRHSITNGPGDDDDPIFLIY